MLQNLTDKSAKADVFMRFFESVFLCQCTVALYRDNFLLRSSRCQESLYKVVENFKPSLLTEEFPSKGVAQLLDADNRPCKSASEATDDELEGKIVVVCLRPHRKNVSPEDSPGTPAGRKTTRGVYLFLELKQVGVMTRVLLDRQKFQHETRFLDHIFSMVEREMLKKTDSK